MTDRKVIPIWEKVGVIPHPSMPASRVDCGLLLALIIREVHKSHYSFAEDRVRAVVDLVIATVQAPDLSVRVHENPDKPDQFCVDILAEDEWPYRYVLYLPASWIRQEQNKE